MNKKYGRLFLCFLFCFFIVLSACRSKKNTQGTVEHKTPKPVKKEESRISLDMKNKQAQYRFFAAKIKSSYKDSTGKERNFTVHLKMEKDQYIWISVTALLGIEAARLYISPDTVNLLDRLNKRYLRKDFSFFSKFSSAPVSLKALQEMFVGNPMFSVPDTAGADTLGTQYVLKHFIESTIALLYISPENMRLSAQQLIEEQRNQRLDIQYSQYKNSEGQLIPGKINVTVLAKEQVNLSFEYQNFSFTPIEPIAFSIPASYEPIE